MDNKITLIATRGLGLIYIFFGINKYAQFMDVNMLPADALSFMEGLAMGGYFFYFLGAFEILGGLCLFLNKFPALGTLIVLPISVNILFFHLFLDMSNVAVGGIAFLANIYLISVFRDNYKSLLK